MFCLIKHTFDDGLKAVFLQINTFPRRSARLPARERDVSQR